MWFMEYWLILFLMKKKGSTLRITIDDSGNLIEEEVTK